MAIRFGDGSQYLIGTGKFHAYRRAGRYTVIVTVVDRAGNQTTVSRVVQIKAPPKPARHRAKAKKRKPSQPKPKPKPKANRHRR